jgi:hypothetical protein
MAELATHPVFRLTPEPAVLLVAGSEMIFCKLPGHAALIGAVQAAWPG